MKESERQGRLLKLRRMTVANGCTPAEEDSARRKITALLARTDVEPEPRPAQQRHNPFSQFMGGAGMRAAPDPQTAQNQYSQMRTVQEFEAWFIRELGGWMNRPNPKPPFRG